MKVFFSPSYSGFVYQNLENQQLFFNSVICNTEGLTSLIELHAGLHIEVKSDFDRVMDYVDAMKLALKKNPENLFAASFKIDRFNTAKECLKWRDVLKLAEWNAENEMFSKRLESLSEIEAEFSDISSGEKLFKIISAVENGCNLPGNLEIITPFDYSCFHPAVRKLLDALKKRNVKVRANDLPEGTSNDLKKIANIVLENKPDKISLKETDRSFEIMKFQEKDQALKYLSLSDDKYDVWINRDNKALDSNLAYLNKPKCGAEDEGVSQISALPLIGIGIFERPFNICSLLNWLSTPVNPIKSEIRNSLSEAIVSSGGYFCDECRKILKEVEEEDLGKIKMFLPDINIPEDAVSENNEVEISVLKNFLENLSLWISGCLRIPDFPESKKQQLGTAFETSNHMLRLLSEIDEDKIQFSELSLAFDSLSFTSKTKVSESNSGSYNVVSTGSAFAGIAGKTIWCDFYNPDEEKLTYRFLSSKEKEFFKDRIWQEEDEKKFNRYNKYLPFLYTKDKLTLVTVEKDGTKDVIEEPLIIRITQNMGKTEDSEGKSYDLIDDFIVRKEIEDIKNVKAKESEAIQNRKQSEEGTVSFDSTKHKPIFRNDESFSALLNLIDNPFDYTFNYILNIKPAGQAALSPVYTTKGSVAHRIIELLFDSVHGGKPADIKNRINSDFDKIFVQAVLEKGEILLLEENKTEYHVLKNKMQECVKTLCDFIDKNQLEVEECEQKHEKVKIDDFKEKAKKIDLEGSIDMLLKDRNGNPVIFDFKYKSRFDKYKDLIEKSRAMQLSVYKAFVRQKKGLAADVLIRSAYVLLPDVKVVTADEFDGNIISAEGSTENLLVKMANSYEFRRQQIEKKGIVEDGEGIDADKLEYVKETDAKNLISLDIENHSKSEIKKTKKGNQYSKYSFFKAGK